MPNLINTDSAGNVFYNYITPVVKGAASVFSSSSLKSGFLDQVYGTTSSANSSIYTSVRLPAPGLETKAGTVTITGGGYPPYATTNARFILSLPQTLQTVVTNNSKNVNVGAYSREFYRSNTAKTFICANDYALVLAEFDANVTDCVVFHYWGWLREPVYTGSVAQLGAIYLGSPNFSVEYAGIRPFTGADSSVAGLSTAANTITSPPIVCTTGTDPGDGSETFTDVVIRDAASPNNPVGKLWNCIDMPATCNVGELWKNTGAYDADGSASEQDVYLCVMPWGTRKLGMRVWTENAS